MAGAGRAGSKEWNNVINMIPARDPFEESNFSAEDRRWFRRWLDWTVENREYLRRTKTIIGQPAMGRIDGTSAIIDDRGFIFLFNPNARRLTAKFVLDGSIGLTARGRYLLREIEPLEGRLIGKPGAGYWSYGDEVSIFMNGGSALALSLLPESAGGDGPLLFNSPGSASVNGGTLDLTRAYSSIQAYRRSFVGFYADLSLLDPDRKYEFELILPRLQPGQFQGLFFENIETVYTGEIITPQR